MEQAAVNPLLQGQCAHSNATSESAGVLPLVIAAFRMYLRLLFPLLLCIFFMVNPTGSTRPYDGIRRAVGSEDGFLAWLSMAVCHLLNEGQSVFYTSGLLQVWRDTALQHMLRSY